MKCIFQTAFHDRQYFLTRLMPHVWQHRAAISLHVRAAVRAVCGAGALPAPAFLPELFPKCGCAWERHAAATTCSPAGGGGGRTCFLGSLLSPWIWDKQFSLLSSSAFGKGKV